VTLWWSIYLVLSCLTIWSFCVQGLRWYMVLRFADICGIVAHHCLNFDESDARLKLRAGCKCVSHVTLLSNRRPYQSTNLPFGKQTFINRSIQIPLFLWEKSLNSDGQQFHKYQQNEEPYITSNLEHKKTVANKYWITISSP
jgi:hypothetical protein